MLHERALFNIEYVSYEQTRMNEYLRILKRGIKEFVTNSQYQILVELQSNAWRMEIKLESQVREIEVDTQRRDIRLVQSQPAAKWVKPNNLILGGHRSHGCNIYGKGHDGTCRRGQYATCMAKRGTLRNISRRVYESVSTTIRRTM